MPDKPMPLDVWVASILSQKPETMYGVLTAQVIYEWRYGVITRLDEVVAPQITSKNNQWIGSLSWATLLTPCCSFFHLPFRKRIEYTKNRQNHFQLAGHGFTGNRVELIMIQSVVVKADLTHLL